MTENERFGLVFVKTGSINSGTGVLRKGRKVAIFIKIYSIYSQLVLFIFNVLDSTLLRLPHTGDLIIVVQKALKTNIT
jgi:hypothetical protein